MATYKKSVAVRNAALDAEWVAIGASPQLLFFSGSAPADVTLPDTGTVLASLVLPATPMAAATAGSKSKTGTWSDPVADAAGTLGYWRIKDSSGTTTHKQGLVTATGGGGEITVSTLTVVAGIPFVVTSYTEVAGNA